MFTGIVEEVGIVHHVSLSGVSGKIHIQAHNVLEGTRIGDSIAVNGVCLTVVSLFANGFVADVMAETMRKSNLGDLRPKDKVNLERAMQYQGRFGGHIVAGHVDGQGVIDSFVREGNAIWMSVAASKDILRYVIEKGSIAIDGVSLTVAYVDDVSFKVSLIPHTGKETILLDKKSQDKVNLENDLVGKCVEKLLLPYVHAPIDSGDFERDSGAMTFEFLKAHGF